MEFAIIILAVLTLTFIVLLWITITKSKSGQSSNPLLDTMKQRIDELTSEVASKNEELDSKTSRIASLTSERDVLKIKLENSQKECAKIEEDKEAALKSLRDSEAQKRDDLKDSYERMLSQEKESAKKQIDQIKESSEAQLNKIQELNQKQTARIQETTENQLNLIKEQLMSASEKVLKQRQSELGDQNVEQVSKIINPLMDKVKVMTEAFNLHKEKQQESFTRLDAIIRLNVQKSETLGETADRLARALTGEVKAQGNFGELKLRQLLEDLELHEGEQYFTQQALRDRAGKRVIDDEGKGLIPDFVLRFPNDRYVVIDSKMSLTAYERYMNAPEGSPEKTAELKNHIASVRANMSRLAKKAYTRYLPEGFNRLDFAFMYVPIESALNLALFNDNTLWKEAYDQGVIILGPQTMYMNLRVLEMMWTQVRQLENQQRVMECANIIVDRVQDFAKRFKDIDTSMRKVVDNLDSFKITIAPTGQSIIKAAQNLVKSGAQENRKKPSLDAGSSYFIEEDNTKMLE